MKKTLFQIVNEVNDETSFLNFLHELKKDSTTNESDWANVTIETFLEAAHEWGQVSRNGLQHYSKSENPWKRCAEIIYMGKIYE